MSAYDMSTDRVIHRATADTDHTILTRDGAALALIEEDGDDDAIGYYQEIGEGEFVYNPYQGYSYYVEGGELHSMHGKPDDMTELDVNDGNQRIAMDGGAIAEMLS